MNTENLSSKSKYKTNATLLTDMATNMITDTAISTTTGTTTGAVTGAATGAVTGAATGAVTGAATGAVTGATTGAVTGAATGTATDTTSGFPDWQLLASRLLSWYAKNARRLPWRETKDPYRIWVSEIMLQQTRVEAVKEYYARFMDELPDVAALAACPEDRLLKLWEGLGYYSRARNLKKAAEQIMTLYDGKLPADHKKLLKLPGIGPYTAGAIASIAFDIPMPAVDGNVLRVRARVFGDDGDIAEGSVKKSAEAELLAFMQDYFTYKTTDYKIEPCLDKTSVSPDKAADSLCESSMPPNDTTPSPGAFNQALMDLGATVCLPNGTPHCDTCPWNALCIARQDDCVGELPVKKKKAPRRIEKRTVFLIMDGERVVLQRRPAKGLLAGLYELPNVTGHLNQKEALAFVRNLSGDATDINSIPASSDEATGVNSISASSGDATDVNSIPASSDEATDVNSASDSDIISGLQPLRIQKLKPAKHIFTHIEWHMIGYVIRVDSLTSESAGLLFAEQKDVKERYSIPSAFDAYIGHIKNNSFDCARLV